ncbi:methyltransferase domain-containing protein [Clostridium sediminicola]|uniref:class I SAM-dependent methyltransferase n=1 Tax=Clostridium sediminicola TaxID=3114879 RepID=UPI0031F255D1
MDNKKFFNEMAEKWDETVYHDDTKLNKIMELSKVSKDTKVLDIGTGTGVLIPYLLKRNVQSIDAVDLSENMIKVAKSKFHDDRINFHICNIMNFKNNGYDYAFIYSAYPHFPDKEKLIKHIHSLLNKDGKIIIAHSQSKEQINALHKTKDSVKEDRLPSAEITTSLMKNYFKIDKVIDNEEMYFILGIKKN